MKWIDRINATVLTVVTGDDKVYRPLFRNVNNNIQEVDMNASVFEFNDIDGAYVGRGAIGPIGIQFEFIFQGENHLEVRDDFYESTRNRTAWAISHPYIGTKTVQPIRMSYDNSRDNVSVISGTMFETIQDIYPANSSSPRQESEIQLQSSIDAGITASNNLNLEAGDITTVGNTTDDMFNKLSAGAVTDIDRGNIAEVIAKTNAALTTIGTDPVKYMSLLADTIRVPARFLDTISNRVSVLGESYEDLVESIQGAPSLGEKFWFEIAGAMNIVAIGEANIIPIEDIAEAQRVDIGEGDIVTRSQIITAINDLIERYNAYMETIGDLQSDVDNKLDSYIPDDNNIRAFQQAIFTITGNLLAIATDALQERLYTVKYDTPLVVLVHRLLGTVDDLIIQRFAKDNGLSRDEVLVVPAGKTVTYFV